MKITEFWNARPVSDMALRGNEARRQGGSFSTELKETLQEVNHLQNRAEEAMVEGAVRGAENIHETMIKLHEAEISLKLLVKTRDKALEAYQEIMRMQF